MRGDSTRRRFLKQVGASTAALSVAAVAGAAEAEKTPAAGPANIQGFEKAAADPNASKGYQPISDRKLRVLVLDKDLPGRATSASAGGLWPVGEAVGLGCGVIYQATQSASKKQNGEAQAESHDGILPASFRDLLVASNALFPPLADELAELSGIDIELRHGLGLLFAIFDQRERGYVEKVRAALPASCQFEDLTPEEAWSVEPSAL